MFDVDSLTEQLFGKVGMYAAFNAGNDKVGLGNPIVYLSDAHKLLRPDIINALAPSFDDIIPAWYEPETVYNKHDLVYFYENADQSEKPVYQSLIPYNTGHSVHDADFWKPISLLQAWYNQIVRGSIAKLSLSLSGSPSGLPVLSRQAIFQKEGNLQGAIPKNGRFLACRMRILKPGVLTNLARDGIQLSGPVANVPIYVFHSSSATPIAVSYLNSNTSGRTVWADVPNAKLSYSDGYYLIGYFESDLPVGVQAIGSERTFTTSGCSSCKGVDYALAAGRQKYMTLESVYVDDADTPGSMTWADETVVATQTWGINLIIEVHCDRTKLLANALLYIIACDVLEELSTSDRLNGLSAQLRNSAYVALYGQDKSKVTDGALSTVRDKALASLNVALASNDCSSTEAPRRGIRFESMFD